MSAFSINQAAKTEIQRILLTSALKDPIASLNEIADPGRALSEAIESFYRQGSESKLLDSMLIEEVEKLTYVLHVGAYERESCPSESLIDVDGVTFSFALFVHKALSDYCLIFENGNFYLKSYDDFASNLRSVKTLSAPADWSKSKASKYEIKNQES